MKKEIEKLLAKQSFTGDDAGRLMILDLLSAYKDLSDGGEGRGVLSDEQKTEIVHSLTFSEDIQRFNDYRGVHDFLTTVPAVYDSYAKTFDVHYWRLSALLTNMTNAEKECFLDECRPVIMTKDMYRLFMESGIPEPMGGVAILQGEAKYNVGKKRPSWRGLYVAETILEERTELITETLDGMKDMMAECLARRKALELIARYVRVPQIKILLPVPDDSKTSVINMLINVAIANVKRPSQGEAYETELKRGLAALLIPIALDALAPLPADVTRARRSLNYSVIKNGSEAFVASLKRKWRE